MTTRKEFDEARRAVRLVFNGHHVAATAALKAIRDVAMIGKASRCCNSGPRLFAVQASRIAASDGYSFKRALRLNRAIVESQRVNRIAKG